MTGKPGTNRIAAADESSVACRRYAGRDGDPQAPDEFRAIGPIADMRLSPAFGCKAGDASRRKRCDRP